MLLPINRTDLEALTWAQTARINELSNLNQILTAQISRQEDLIAKYKASASASPPPPTPSPIIRPPEHPTPFYLDSRSASQVQLSFIIPGFKGESLPVGMRIVDMAFILEQTLERRGWGKEMTRKGVEDFLERPMVEVRWMGREGEIGRLD